mgnify:CR=1 FL=1
MLAERVHGTNEALRRANYLDQGRGPADGLALQLDAEHELARREDSALHARRGREDDHGVPGRARDRERTLLAMLAPTLVVVGTIVLVTAMGGVVDDGVTCAREEEPENHEGMGEPGQVFAKPGGHGAHRVAGARPSVNRARAP